MSKKRYEMNAGTRRARRVRARVKASGRLRLSVYRSARHIYAQIIDDVAGVTLVSASTIDRELRPQMQGLKKTEQARLVGQALAQRALAKGITKVVFDRGGYKFIGRVKALADGAREGGLEF